MSISPLIRASLSFLLLSGMVATTVQPAFTAMPTSAAQSQKVVAEPTKDPFLLKVRKSGGFCPDNQCFSELTILQNGTYRYEDAQKTGTGKLSRRAFTQLKRRLARLNIEQVRSKPFTGTCPIAYDGPETFYRFLIGNTVEEISDCKSAIDPQDPLFQQINRLYDKAVETVYQAEQTPNENR